MKKIITIDNKKLLETLGFEFDIEFIKGPSRNNEMFAEINIWKNNEIEYFKIEKSNNEIERYRFIYFKKNNEIKKSKWNTSLSFGTRLYDYLLLTSSNIEVHNKINMNDDKKIIEYFLNKIFSTKEAIDLFDKAIEGNNDKLFKYWKQLSKFNNHFSKWVIPRLNLIIYKYIRSIDNNYATEENDKKLDKTWRIEKLNNIFSHLLKSILVTEIDKKFKNNIKDISEYLNINFLPIESLIKSIENGKIKIPVFQREYVWDINKIIKLLNSILKDHPIGSILLAKINNLNLNKKNTIIQNISINNKNDEEIIYVLDGQQRILSILLVLLLNNLKQKILSNPKGELARIIKLSKIEEIYFEDNNQKFKLVKGNKFSNRNNLISIKKINNKIFELIKDYKIYFIYIKEKKLDDLIEIFQNINIGSKKLTKIDLLHSVLYGQNSDWNLLKSLQELKNNPFIKKFELKDEKMVQMIKLVYDFQDQPKQLFDIRIKTIFNKINNQNNSKKFMECIFNTEKLIEWTIKILSENYGYTNYASVPNMTFLFSISTYIWKEWKNPIQSFDDTSSKEVGNFIKNKIINSLDKILSYIIKRSINGKYSSSTSTKVNEDIKNIFENKINNVDLKRTLNEEIKEVKYGSSNALYKIIISQLSLLSPVSLIDGETLVYSLNRNFSKPNKDQHHFLPKKCKDFKNLKKEMCDQIQNIFLIDYEENRNKISNRSPKEYLMEDVLEKKDEALQQISETHLLDLNLLKKFYYNDENLEKLLEKLLLKRKDKIIELLNKKWKLDKNIL